MIDDFGTAIAGMMAGERWARRGWSGKDMWVTFSPGHVALPAHYFWADANRRYAESQGGTAEVLPCFTMKTADGKILMGWLASQTDMAADDWFEV